MILDIALPFYGSFDYLKTAVRSVLAQSDPGWRLVVIDDVYPDPEPGEWVRSLGDPRVSYRRNERNLGVSGNFNESVSLMTGDYGVIFGGDDVMLPGFVARAKELIAQNPDAAVIQPGVQVIDDDGVPYLPLVDRVKDICRFGGTGVRTYSGEVLAVSLLRGDWAYFPSLIWRLDKVRPFGFQPDLKTAQDLVLLLDIIAAGGSLVLDDWVVFQYRRHRHSASSSAANDGTRFHEEHDLFSEQAGRFADLGWRRAARAARMHITSRLNAVTRIPVALRRLDGRGLRALLAHSVGGRSRD